MDKEIHTIPITQIEYNKLVESGNIRDDAIYKIINEEEIWETVLEELKEIKQLIKEIRK